MTEYAIRIVHLARGGTTPIDGQWLVEYDPTRPGVGPQGQPMSAHVVCSPDPAAAKRFPDKAAAHAYWELPSGRRPPADKPLTAYLVDVVDPDDAPPLPPACGTCGRITHRETEHPLPPDHDDYDAFHDAPDDVLARMVSDALKSQGWQ